MRAAAFAAPSVSTGQVVDLPADLLGDRLRDHLGSRFVEVHAPPGAVALEAVADVEVLLEVVAQREVEEGPAVSGQLHGRRQAALHDREVAGGQVSVELVHVRVHLEAVLLGERRRIDARARDDDHAQLGDELLRCGVRVDDASEQIGRRRPSRRR